MTPSSSPSYTYIAVDVSKSKLQVASPSGSKSLSYTREVLIQWIQQLREIANVLVVFEATGGYESRLMLALAEANIPQHRINPRRLKGFAASEGIRAKTDPIDARLILKFAQEKALEPMAVPAKQYHHLAELMDRRSHLSEQLSREKNRHHMASPAIGPLIQQMIDLIEGQIAEVDRRIQQVLQSHKEMERFSQMMQSVKGVGKVTAWTLLAYLPELFDPSVGRNQLVALAGLAPFNRDSGKKKGKRFIQAGRAKIRRCLFMAARSAATHNPVINPYVTRLVKDQGKPYKSALTAAMRKILIHLQSSIRNEILSLA